MAPDNSFIMTLESDEEIDVVHESSDEEIVEPITSDQAKCKKPKKKETKSSKVTDSEMRLDFEFDDMNSVPGDSTYAVVAKEFSCHIPEDKLENVNAEKVNEDAERSTDEEDIESDVEEDVEEEIKLQEALVKNKVSTKELADEVEKKKASKFFEENPFAQKNAVLPSSFYDLKLSRPLLRAIEKMGYKTPTPIQQQAIPVALLGKDLCASAQTGSGKTAAFLLPILERLLYRPRRVAATRVLVICPVRELAQQCQSVMLQLAQFTDISCALSVGGLPMKAQEIELRNRPDVVVCTPGRMIDHLRNTQSVHMDDLEILVLDEADRLLELGFTEEVEELVRMCPKGRQTMLFSATLSSKVDQLIKLSMNRPVRLSTDPIFDMAKHLIQEFVRIRPTRESDREAILLALCSRTFKSNTMVFLEQKRHAHRIKVLFTLAGLKAAELHGDLDQKQRLESLQLFRDKKVDILLCTDVAARGIDIKGVDAVLNYEMPKDITTYVHRVGRTARAGNQGRAVTLASENRRLLMKQVMRHCHGFVKSRAVPDLVIEQWRKRIEELEPDIKNVLLEESLENKLKLAEREATRAENIFKHQDEIKSRPAKSWFQTEKEKEKVKEKAFEAKSELNENNSKKKRKGELEKKENEKVHKLNRKKRRLLEIRKDEQRSIDERQETNENSIQSNKYVFTEKSVAAAAKSAKRLAQSKRFEKDMLSASDLLELKNKKQGKEQKTKSNLFDNDLSQKKSSKNTKIEKKSIEGRSEFQFKGKVTNLRKGGKLGAKSFKSKARFKRR